MIGSIVSDQLTDEENEAIRLNLAQLATCQELDVLRSNFYNSRERLQSFGFSIPPQMRNLDVCLGWPAKTVNVLSSRLKLHGFVPPGHSVVNPEMSAIWGRNRMALRWPQAQVSTFIHGCSFVAVTPGDVTKGEPEVLISVMPATEATGIWDVRRQQLASALWIPTVDAMFPTTAVLFLPKTTVQMSRPPFGGDWTIRRVRNVLPRLPVTLLSFRPQLDRPFGQSRISWPVMELTQMAVRTLLRTEVSAEFYSSPQRWAMGADEEAFVDADGNPVSPWESILGKVWMLPRDEAGEVPEVGQFTPASMQPHTDMMRMITTMFAGETSLPVSTLGIVHDNPASAEAMDAAWADLVGEAELCQTELGLPAVEVAQNALMLSRRSGLDDDLSDLQPKWQNAALPTRAAMADAVTKQVAAGILLPDSEVALEQLGYDQTDIRRIRAEHLKARTAAPSPAVPGLVNPIAATEPPVPAE